MYTHSLHQEVQKYKLPLVSKSSQQNSNTHPHQNKTDNQYNCLIYKGSSAQVDKGIKKRSHKENIYPYTERSLP